MISNYIVFCFINSNRSLSAIVTINSELVGFPFAAETV